MAGYDSLHGGQPESGPCELSPGMQPLEGSENYFVVGVVEADSIVADVVDRDIILVLDDAKFDPSVIASVVLPKSLAHGRSL